MRSRDAGFTLIEVIIVTVVLGILFSVIIANVRGEVISNQIRTATSEVALNLERARSAAIRTSKDASLTLSTGGASYDLRTNGVAATDPLVTYAVPGGVILKINASTAAATIKYNAPYGDLDAIGRTLTFSKSGGTDQTIYLVGVTGKVTR